MERRADAGPPEGGLRQPPDQRRCGPGQERPDAVVRADDICLTIGDALKRVRGHEKEEMSRATTFITGPSRTADIELTLTVGVHGPKELYVIILDNRGPETSSSLQMESSLPGGIIV